MAYDKVRLLGQEVTAGYSLPNIEGYNIHTKIVILAKLAFWITVPIDTIPCMRITSVSNATCPTVPFPPAALPLVNNEISNNYVSGFHAGV
jgi:homoserine dehydrogenase